MNELDQDKDDCVETNSENCECLSCRRYEIYKKEKDEFKFRVYKNLLQPEDVKNPYNDDKLDCPCEMDKRKQCLDEGPNSICYKIRHNIVIDDCDCETVIPSTDIDRYVDTVTSYGKNLPVHYMETEMNRFESYLPSGNESIEQEIVDKLSLSQDKSVFTSTTSTQSSNCKHVPLPLPIFTSRLYDTEENPNNFDVYHMNAKTFGLSARSAFKLLQIDEKYGILKDAKKVVDLCAAPGGWSKVISARLFFGHSDISLYSTLAQNFNENDDNFQRSDIKIVAVDLMDMLPIPGVTKIVGDICKIETANAVINEFNGEFADVVVCDGAADVSLSLPMGNIMHRMVIFSALHITCNILKLNGSFVMKAFYCNALPSWVKMMRQLFASVEVYKPDSSRHTSPECFLICQKYNPPEGFEPKLLTQYTCIDCQYDFSHLTGVNKEIIPILVCDDASFKEKDKNYIPLLEVYENHCKILANNEKNPQWELELAHLKSREKSMAQEEYDAEFKVILQRIKERTADDERLAKETRDKMICELEKRGYERDILEFGKFSKSRNAEIQRLKEWAKIDALLCHEDDGGTMADAKDWEEHVVNVIQPINRDKLIRNAECRRLETDRAAEEVIIQKRIDLYTRHQKNKFGESDIGSRIKFRVPKSSKKNNTLVL